VSFEMVEHTGDLAVRLRAPDLGGLVVSGVLALRSILFEGEPAPGAPTRVERARVRGVDREDALVQALAEALHALQSGALYPLEIRARASAAHEIALELVGAPVDGANVRRVDEIKAVTYHGVAIAERDGELETLVVFDV
jgi:SHS2 domain-containing protein